MNRNLITRLSRSIIQHVPRGTVPAAQITAPERENRILSMLSERERLAQFEHSRDFHARRAAESSAPGMDYDQELSEGFELKYGRA